ncbi:MAG: hypothetical protein MJY82_10575 [Fibrobacter sp.]|nr:hypothetical protein [Fibrobacter sp.]
MQSLACASIAVAFAMFTACSDNASVAGTAVEPNQQAYENISSSSDVVSSSSAPKTATSSASVPQSSSVNPASSSSGENTAASFATPVPASSATQVPSSSPSNPESSSTVTPPWEDPQSSSGIDDNSPGVQEPTNRLGDFIWQYRADVEFDENVLAYHLVGCDPCEQGEICAATPAIYEEFRHAVFYSEVDSDVIKYLFPKAENLISTRTKPLECPLRLLNVETRSNTGFVLTKISADTLTVVDLEISSSCNVSTEKKVFGILFMYCGEFSSNVVVEHKEPEKSTADVCVPEYETEWINWNLL